MIPAAHPHGSPIQGKPACQAYRRHCSLGRPPARCLRPSRFQACPLSAGPTVPLIPPFLLAQGRTSGHGKANATSAEPAVKRRRRACLWLVPEGESPHLLRVTSSLHSGQAIAGLERKEIKTPPNAKHGDEARKTETGLGRRRSQPGVLQPWRLRVTTRVAERGVLV